MKLEDITELIVDSEHKTAPIEDEGYPYIRTPNIGKGRLILDDVRRISKESYKKWTRRAVPKKNDLILAREAPVGNVAIVTDGLKPCLGQRTVLIRPNEDKIYPSYLVYLLLGDKIQERFHAVSTGSTVPHLNMSDIRGLVLPELPAYETQQKIASILSDYDNLIENNTRRIAILEEMARLIYREWFVHYRYPGHENDRLVDSGTELGEVPEGWKIGTIGDLYDVKSGFAFKSKKLVDQGSFGVIKIGNIQSGDIDVEGVQFIENDEIPDRASKFKLHPGDVLIAMTGAKVGKVGIMPKTKNPYYLNQRVGKYFGKKEPLKSHLYLYSFLNSREAQVNIEHLAQGAAQPNISATDLKSLKLPIPPEIILNEYEELTLPMRDEMLTLRQKNVKLKETRDLFLPRLISGKIKIQ